MEPKVKQKVEKIFDRYRDIDTLWVTEDGQVFVNKAMAMNHAYKDGALRRDRPLNVEMVKRDDIARKAKDEGTAAGQKTETKAETTESVSSEGPDQETEPKTTETEEDGAKTAETNEAKTEEKKATDKQETSQKKNKATNNKSRTQKNSK